jgi:hypothetical protein
MIKLQNLYIYSLFLVLSCQNQERQTVANKYFDVKGFVNTQMADFEARKPTVTKRITMDDSVDVLTTNAIDWKSEFELFLQADINKPSYQASYEISRPDSNTYNYYLKSTEKLLVKNLMIVLDSLSKKPIFIKVLVKDVNKLYNSEKNLTMICDSKGVVQSYEVSGFQHLTMSDLKKYSVSGKIE